MIEQDTVKLLRECDSGVKMGVQSIDDVIEAVHAEPLRRTLRESRREHQVLGAEIQSQLQRFHDEGRAPNPMVTAMSWIKTEAKLTADPSDSTVAELMTDGCNMGIKSLNRYLNQYVAADERSKDITKRLIHLEQKLGSDISAYL